MEPCKKRFFVINTNSSEDIKRIINRYIEKYGNISISELLDKLNTDCLILN